MTHNNLPYIIPQIQVTLDCNFNCTYCFQNHKKGVIDLDTVAAIIEKTISHNTSINSCSEHILIIWHGGEPLMAGKSFFEQVIALESRFKGIRFHNRIQTNGSLMTKELARFFAVHDFHLGFSLDGPQKIHNSNRCFKHNGQGTFDAVIKGILTFKEIAGLDRIPVIAVVTKETLGKEKAFFDFFKTLGAQVQLDIYDLRIKDLQSNLWNKNHPHAIVPGQDDIGKFLIRIFDLWFNDNSRQMDFTELRNDVRMILMPELDRGDPFHKKRCDPGRIIFDPLGRAFSCDQYINDDLTSLGNICEDPIHDILERKIRLWEQIKSHIRKSGKAMACGSCQWGHRHIGGCLTCMKYNALLLDARARGLAHWTCGQIPESIERIRGETYYCKGLKAFRTHALNAVQKELGENPIQAVPRD